MGTANARRKDYNEPEYHKEFDLLITDNKSNIDYTP